MCKFFFAILLWQMIRKQLFQIEGDSCQLLCKFFRVLIEGAVSHQKFEFWKVQLMNSLREVTWFGNVLSTWMNFWIGNQFFCQIVALDVIFTQANTIFRQNHKRCLWYSLICHDVARLLMSWRHFMRLSRLEG